MDKIIRVGAVINAPLGACSYYRSIGPYSKIENVFFNILDKGNWSVYSNIDILYLERPVLQPFIDGIELAKSFNIPVIIDFDDDLFNIPKYNPAYNFYLKKQTRDNIKKACNLADVITVTTPRLQKLYSEWNDNVILIENSWNDINFPFEIKNASENKIINWRGSATHRDDLLSYKNGILNSSLKLNDWKWSWMGKDIDFITNHVKNKILFEESEIIKYFNNLFNLSPAIQIVPLENNIFNEGKSNISWIEATWAGAVTVGPNLPEWNRPGIVRVSNNKEFEESILELSNDYELRNKYWNESKKFITDNLLIRNINNKRKDLLKTLLRN
jgi:hypothetical protein